MSGGGCSQWTAAGDNPNCHWGSGPPRPLSPELPGSRRCGALVKVPEARRARVRVPGSHLSWTLDPRGATLVSGCLFSCFLEGLVASPALQKWKHTWNVLENELQPVTLDWHLGSACPRRHARVRPGWPLSARRFSVLRLASLRSLRSAGRGQRGPGPVSPAPAEVREDRSGRQARVTPGCPGSGLISLGSARHPSAAGRAMCRPHARLPRARPAPRPPP